MTDSDTHDELDAFLQAISTSPSRRSLPVGGNGGDGDLYHYSSTTMVATNDGDASSSGSDSVVWAVDSAAVYLGGEGSDGSAPELIDDEYDFGSFDESFDDRDDYDDDEQDDDETEDFSLGQSSLYDFDARHRTASLDVQRGGSFGVALFRGTAAHLLCFEHSGCGFVQQIVQYFTFHRRRLLAAAAPVAATSRVRLDKLVARFPGGSDYTRLLETAGKGVVEVAIAKTVLEMTLEHFADPSEGPLFDHLQHTILPRALRFFEGVSELLLLGATRFQLGEFCGADGEGRDFILVQTSQRRFVSHIRGLTRRYANATTGLGMTCFVK